ncbi:MAG: hypothetical protein M3441_17055 [Chloroflexota bacterium]|nr:hypothetical protein [Chloroflexota bacterium]
MTESKYRRDYVEELGEGAEQGEAYLVFSDKSKSANERQRAIESATLLTEQEQVTAALSVIRDKEEDAELRSATLYAMTTQVSGSPDLIDMVIGLLRDADEPTVVRMTALQVLQQSSFRASVFSPKRAEYLAALREVLNAKDASLREEALEILAQEKDEYAQRMLLEGLEKRSKPLVRPAKAIQLLGYDVHGKHTPILKQMAKNAPSRLAKQEAIRLLAADSSSAELLSEILNDKNENPEVRRSSALALQSAAPEVFEEHAQRIALDDEEDDRLRVSSITALTLSSRSKGGKGRKSRKARAQSGRDDQFKKQVEQLAEKAASKQLGRAAARYMSMTSEQPE